MIKFKILTDQWIDVPRSPPLCIFFHFTVAVLRFSQMSKFTQSLLGFTLGGSDCLYLSVAIVGTEHMIHRRKGRGLACLSPRAMGHSSGDSSAIQEQPSTLSLS